MTRFDAELYLRLRGEEMVLDRPGDRGVESHPIVEAASALVAVGEITAAAAQRVVDDYSLAITLRGDPQELSHRRRRRARFAVGRAATRAKRPFKPRRVVPCERELKQPNGTMFVRYVTLSDEGTSIAFTFRSEQPHPPPGPRSRFAPNLRVQAGPWSSSPGPPQVPLGDDRGNRTNAHFSGSYSDAQVDGHLTSHAPLSRDTTWLEINGERLELSADPPEVEVTIEPLPEETPAARYLWQRAAVGDRHHGSAAAVEPAIDALIAAGRLSAEDELVRDVRAVLDTIHHGRSPSPPGARPLPEPWRSLTDPQRRQHGPSGTAAIGAVTPLFDGIAVAVAGLQSGEDSFGLEAEVRPGIGIGWHSGDWQVHQRQLAWWAADDRGNHYLGQLGSWGGNDDQTGGTVSFFPALDPKASVLEIMPTAVSARAVIRVPLPWASAQGERGDA